MQCPQCEFHNAPGLASCVRCASLLDFARVSFEPPRDTRGAMGRAARRTARHTRRSFGGTLHRAGLVFQARRVLPNADATAVVLSVIPGLGQWRLGKRHLGLCLFGLWIFTIILALIATGTNAGWFLRMSVVAVHCLAINLLLMQDLLAMTFLRRALFGITVYACVMLCVYLPAVAAIGRVGSLVRVDVIARTTQMSMGDVFLIGGAWTNPKVWQRGHVVSYNTRRAASGGMLLQAGQNIDRIVALEGDVVSVRDGRLYVNGVVPPPELQTLATLGGIPDFTTPCQPGHVIIIPSAMMVRRMNNYHGRIDTRWVYQSLMQVKTDEIRGRLILRLRPLSEFGFLPDAPAPASASEDKGNATEAP